LHVEFGNEEDGNPLRVGRRDHWVRLPGSRPKFFRGSQVGKAPHCYCGHGEGSLSRVLAEYSRHYHS